MSCLQIVSHRGLWQTSAQRNTVLAFRRALDGGFGIETDVRDRCGELVISHDPPVGGETTLAEFLDLYGAIRPRPALALNIKADGLQQALAAQLAAVPDAAAFTFDMSIPDTLGYLEIGIPVFVRQSEYEPIPTFYDQAAGVWLDAFRSEWFEICVIAEHLTSGKRVCLVSPELHRRPHAPLWQRLRQAGLNSATDLLLCTDLPLEARAFFS